MRPGSALVAALGDLYHQSWRLFLLNASLSALVIPILIAGLWLWPLWLLLVGIGPLLAALMHCAVVVAVTDDLRLRDALDGLRLHWRRGLVLGAVLAVVTALGVYAVSFYADRGALVLAALTSYVLFGSLVYQLVLWPLAIYELRRPIVRVLAEAARTLAQRPVQALVLALVLAAVNLAGIAAAIVPFLTLTIAYTFLAAARFALPVSTTEERWPA